MKLTVILLTAFCLNLCAAGHGQTVTISVKNASLEKVFGEIEKQTGYGFVYRWEIIQKTRPIDLQLNQVPLKEALDICFKDQPVSYSIVDKTIIVSKKEEHYDNLINKPLLDIKGKVINEKGEPVAGASIRVKGSDKGTSTDDNGEFILGGINEDAILIISGTNIETKEIKLNGSSGMSSFTVRTRITEGEQVVINTGYAKISSERYVGAYSQLSNTQYESRTGMDIISRLEGMTTGILFDKTKTSGYDQLASLQIRGISTLTTPQSPSPVPLIIVDNFPFKQDLNSLNPNDIENITILKDAAATSIWGAQAGNGVIVITTKKARYGQPVQVSLASNITISDKPNQYYYPQMSIPDFVDAEIMLFNKGAYDANLNDRTTWPVISPVVEILAKRRAGKISSMDSATQIDAFKELDTRRELNNYVYRPAVAQQHFISISGGNNVFNYSFSGGYNYKLNNIQNSKADDQFTINSNTGFRPIRNVEITTGINYSQSTQKSANFLLGTSLPYVQLADAQGHALAIPYHYRNSYLDTVGGGNLLDWKYRPLEEPGLTDRRDITRFIMLNIGINYRFTNWLNAALSYQYGNSSSDNKNYYSPETYYTRNLINQFTNLSQTNPALRNPFPIGGILSVLHSQTITQNARGQLNFNKNFGTLHQVTASVAAEMFEAKATGDGTTAYGYNKEIATSNSILDYTTYFPSYGNLQGNERIPYGNGVYPETVNRFVSFLTYGSYTYDNRYTVYASARKDGSNVFGVNTNRKWKPLWSTGVSWDISKENFYHIKLLSSFRLRASYGYSGNPGNASGLPTIIYGSRPSGLANLTYAIPGNPPNPDLRWERVGTVNVGLDFSLLNDRVSGSMDFWQKKSTDIISGTPLAPSTGNQSLIINTASLKGNGFEIRLNSKNIDGRFKWLTSFGLSHSKTVVTKLFFSPHRAEDFVTYGLNAAEGQLAFGVASYKWAGLDPQTGDPRGYLNKQVSTDYFAILNDSVGNQVFHGSAIPLYFGFISNSLCWKNFTLFVNITYRFDFYFRKPTINYTNLVYNWQGNADYALRWQKPGDEKYTNVPSLIYPFPSTGSNRDLFYQYSEINVLRGDNIRLQDIQLQYNLNNGKHKKNPFKKFQVFAQVNNINMILWRKDKSRIDADFVGQDYFTPISKTWTGGIKINF